MARLIRLTPAAGRPPRPPRVYFPNGLTPIEHAIAEARRWQLANVSPDGIASPAYAAIVGLLGTFKPDKLRRVYQKAGLP